MDDLSIQKEIKPILVIGVGNSLQMDDGIGIHVLEELNKQQFPPEVEFLEGGTSGIDMVNFLKGRKKVIIIDAVNGRQVPGSLFRFTPDDLQVNIGNLDSLHSLGILETVNIAKLLQIEPEEVIVIGIQPKTIDWGMELTSELSAVLPKAVNTVIQEINNSLSQISKNKFNKTNIGSSHVR